MRGTAAFDRSIQMDEYSCGAHAVFMIAKHCGMKIKYKEVKKELGTNTNGTKVRQMLAFFYRHKFRAHRVSNMRFRELKSYLGHNEVVLVHVDGDHFAVVHGITENYVYMADPSIDRMYGLRLPKKKFKKRWKKWGIAVSRG